MQKLTPEQYPSVKPLFQPIAFHLCLRSLLDGGIPGEVWVDSPAQPRSALVQYGRRLYLGGSEDNPEFFRDLGTLFTETIYPHAIAENLIEFVLFYPSERWDSAIESALAGKNPMRSLRQHYQMTRPPDPAWRRAIPAGFWIEQLSDKFLEERQLENFDGMFEELTSEAPTVEAFLAGRFGFCLRDTTRIAGWCTSEYNQAGSCEVGIETVGEFQRKGVARATASALIEYAFTQGYREIGWDCWKFNTASARAALSIGFELQHEYPVFHAWFDAAANLAVHGNMCMHAGKPDEALEWFTRALQTGSAPLWAHISCAFAHNQLGDPATALECVRAALTAGFTNRAWITTAPQLLSLHDTPEWRALFPEQSESAG